MAGANEPRVEQLLKMTNVHQIVGLHPTTVAPAAGFENRNEGYPGPTYTAQARFLDALERGHPAKLQ